MEVEALRVLILPEVGRDARPAALGHDPRRDLFDDVKKIGHESVPRAGDLIKPARYRSRY
jgi:hypothetical protein